MVGTVGASALRKAHLYIVDTESMMVFYPNASVRVRDGRNVYNCW